MRLDVELFLRAGGVLAFDDEVRVIPDGIHVTARDEKLLEDVVGPPDDRPALERVVDRQDGRQRIDLDRDRAPRLFDEQLVGVGEENDRLFRVVHDAVRQARLIVQNEHDAVRRRHVLRGDDGELVPGKSLSEVDVLDPAARSRTSDGDAVQHARQRDVVDVLGVAGNFGAAFLAGDGLPDETRRHVTAL